VGVNAASPTPTPTRAAKSPAKLVMRPQTAVISDQKKTPPAMMLRRLPLSAQVPIRTIDNVWTYNVNAGKAAMQGLELEVGGTVAEGLRLSLAYAYVDSSIVGDVFDNITPPRLVIKDAADGCTAGQYRCAL
jgi:outer membrane receptor protein involved in Fe transport